MTTREPIKTGKLVLIKVWPATIAWIPTLDPQKERNFRAFGYRRATEYWRPTSGNTVALEKAENKGFIGMIVDNDFTVKKSGGFAGYRFYKVLVVAKEAKDPLWFPESDITMLTEEALKEMAARDNNS
jgi:hypothetical protein